MDSSAEITLAEVTAARTQNKALEAILNTLHTSICVIIRQARIHTNNTEDAAQDAVLEVIRCIDNYEAEYGGFRAYALSCIRAMLKPDGRNGARYDRYRWVPKSLTPGVEPVLNAKNTALEAADLLATLPCKQRDYVNAYFGLDGPELTIRQIAAIRGVKEAEVQRNILEAVHTMRELGNGSED